MMNTKQDKKNKKALPKEAAAPTAQKANDSNKAKARADEASKKAEYERMKADEAKKP